MRVLYFGTYERDYPRNAQVISSLRLAGVDVIERHASVWERRRHKWSLGVGAALRVAGAETRLLFGRGRSDFDAVIVGYPGHFDMPAARRLAGRRPLVFNPLVSLFDTLVEDRGRFKQGTAGAGVLRQVDRIAFRRADLSVLTADLDPQGNLSDYFDVPPDAEPTMGDVLAGRVRASEAVHDGIIPANLSLAESELMLAGRMGRELTLRKALKDVEDDYDVILIDCPPSLGLLTVNALVAADYALLSSEAQYFALQGVEQALEVIELARDGLNPDLEWLGVVFNIADMRTVHSRDSYTALREHFGDRVFSTVIRASIAYAESAEKATSILDHRPDLGADYMSLAAEVLERVGLEGWRRKLEPLLAGTAA